MKDADKTKAQLLAELAELRADLTERKRAEEALRESEARALRKSEEGLQQITEASFEGIVFHVGGVVLGGSQQYFDMFGYREDEVMGKQAMPITIAPESQETIRSRIAGGSLETYEAVGMRKDGSRFPIEIRIREAEYQGRKARVGIVRDITEHKRAQEALRESEARFRLLMEHSPLSMAVYGHDGTQVAVNKAFEELWQVSREDTVGKFNILETKFVEDQGRKTFAERAFAGEIVHTPDIEIDPREDFATSQPRTVRGYLYPLSKSEGSARGIVVVHEDISERIRAEEDRRQFEVRVQQAQRMESLGVLAGGVAHDFNNMLGVIIGYTDIAIGDVEPGSEAHGCMEQVMVAATRAAEMVEQILTFSRRVELGKCVVSLAALVEEAMKLLRSTLPSSIVMRSEIASDVPPVIADTGQVQQVIMNICTNAHHAMWSQGGRLTVGLSHHHVTPEEAAINPQASEGEYAHLFVRDTGAGIAPDILNRIFEPFFTTKEVGEGSGMGLATSHGIVAGHGGFITVESEVGAGSVFHVYLPAAPAEVKPEKEAAQDSDWVLRGRERVLVVDDETVMLEMASNMLQELGYRVTTFSSSSDALTALQQSPLSWDLLITDQTMPGMGGIELLKAAGSLRDDLPVVIMTGHSDKLTLDIDGGVGADAVLKKPFRRAELSKRLRQVLDGRNRSPAP